MTVWTYFIHRLVQMELSIYIHNNSFWLHLFIPSLSHPFPFPLFSTPSSRVHFLRAIESDLLDPNKILTEQWEHTKKTDGQSRTQKKKLQHFISPSPTVFFHLFLLEIHVSVFYYSGYFCVLFTVYPSIYQCL